jgi:hypothetical protein
VFFLLSASPSSLSRPPHPLPSSFFLSCFLSFFRSYFHPSFLLSTTIYTSGILRIIYQNEEEDDLGGEQPTCLQIVKKGFLLKQGGSMKNWKRRWFVLFSDATLCYYNTPSVCNFSLLSLPPPLFFFFCSPLVSFSSSFFLLPSSLFCFPSSSLFLFSYFFLPHATGGQQTTSYNQSVVSKSRRGLNSWKTILFFTHNTQTKVLHLW